ncbi:MAG: hypothetical protein JW895_02185 [Thermoleophilaceae bacterium]|nr:hypothetical protein [Thermoleophilaceae bacterium]
MTRLPALLASAVAVATLAGCAPTYNWLAGSGGPTQEDEADGISADSGGRVIVAGKFLRTATWGTQTRTAAGGEDMFVARYTPAGALISVATYGAGADDAIFDSTTGPSDATYLSGWFGQTVSFGACAGCTAVSAGGHDMALVKQDAAGSTQWVRRLGGAAEDGGNEVETDAAGNVYVLALSNGPFSDGAVTWANDGDIDSFVIKFRPDGTRVWTRKIGGSGRQRARGIETTGGGAVVVTGEAFGATTIGSDSYSIAGRAFDVWTARLDGASGAVLDSAVYGTAGVEDVGRGIAGDAGGDAFLSGTFTGTMSFGGGVSVQGDGDAAGTFVARLGPDGTPRWANAITSASAILGGENVTDAAGNLYVTGSYTGPTKFSSTGGPGSTLSAGATRAFIAKYDPAGRLLWVSSPSQTDVRTVAGEIAPAPGGRLVMAGVVFGTVQYPGTAAYSASEPDNKDMFVLSVNTD